MRTEVTEISKTVALLTSGAFLFWIVFVCVVAGLFGLIFRA